MTADDDGPQEDEMTHALRSTAPRVEGDGGAAGGTRGPGVLSSAALLQDRAEVLIEHRGETYRLRQTRQGKLILTK